MSIKRVIAFGMHETEIAAASRVIHQPEATESFVIGDTDESGIVELEKEGLIVQILDAQPELELVSSAAEKMAIRSPLSSMAARSATGFLKGESARVNLPEGSLDYVVISTLEPMMNRAHQALESLDAMVVEALPGNRVMVRMPIGKINELRQQPWVEKVVAMVAMDSMPIAADVAASRHGPVASPGIVPYDIMIREEAATSSVVSWLANNGATISGKSRKKVRVFLPENSPLLDQIASLPEVDGLEPYLTPKLHNDVARQIMGIEIVGGNPCPYTGRGQIVAIADTGIDDSHSDFTGRIVGKEPLGRSGVTDDPHGHGTHVAGSVLGDGSASANLHQGAAPDAKLYFQSLLDSQGDLGGLPVDLNDLFDTAYKAGARIHNNSWGAVTRGTYRASSREVDEFVSDHRDMLIVISAGNEGTAADPPSPDFRNAPPGNVNWNSIGAPATAKNALTVGASRSSRPSGAYATMSYGALWPNDFPANPMASEQVSGDPSKLAGFSSRGLCDDYRVKPDVVAPGTDVISCKSSIAPLRNFWGPVPGKPAYAFDGGTSMSAPLVAGFAALVREYYGAQQHTPSAALVKATIINGAEWLLGSDAIADHSTQPNYHQGFGRVCLPQSIPIIDSDGSPSIFLRFVDEWQNAASNLTRVGQRHQFRFRIDADADLNLCLAYTDLPGRSLQNNLNLLLEYQTTKQKWAGNEGRPLRISLDSQNNVEVIRIKAKAGSYLVQVFAQNFPFKNPSQDYALVVSASAGISQWVAMQ